MPATSSPLHAPCYINHFGFNTLTKKANYLKKRQFAFFICGQNCCCYSSYQLIFYSVVVLQIVIKVQEKISMQIWLYLSIFIIDQNKTLCLTQAQIFMKTCQCQENLVFFPPSKVIDVCSNSVKSRTFHNFSSKLLQCFIHVKTSFTMSREQPFFCGRKERRLQQKQWL